MLKKILMPVCLSMMLIAPTFAAVDVNSADQAALDGIAGVGPATSKAIIAERDKNGKFKDWADLERRVKGIGERNAVKLSAAGMTVGGKPYETGAPAQGAKPMKVDTKPTEKAPAGKQ